MFSKFIRSLFFIFININLLLSQELNVKVDNILEFNNAIKNVVEGTTIVLNNGEWSNVKLNIDGFGTKEKPIVVKAETPGKVLVTGDSNWKINSYKNITEIGSIQDFWKLYNSFWVMV